MAVLITEAQPNHYKAPVDLTKFAITRNAFLPEKSMPKILSNPYYAPWELIIQHLPEHIRNGTVRDVIAQLPVLSTRHLKSEAEWRRAYVMLAYLTSAHTWGGDQPEEILPPQITIPFLEIADHVEMPPGVSYTATNLWNFTSTNEDDFSNIDDLDVIVSFTGTKDEVWFLMISVAMEAQAAGILQIVMNAIDAIRIHNYPVITNALRELHTCIQNVSRLLGRMGEGCDPLVFYHQIRPFLAGSKNMEHAGLPRGLFYDEGDGRGEWRQLRGGSNGQSSLIQFFDIALGVEHYSHGSVGKKSYHDEVREYMPGPHRRFLEYISRLGSIREAVLNSPTTEEELRAAYVAATDALSSFRDRHIQIVTRYIILPSKQAPRQNARKNLASASAEKNGSQELTGTGGTTLVPFLKQARDETAEAGQIRGEVASLFEDAQNAVFKLMASDSVPKFLRSPKYEQQLRNYEFDVVG
ncbi:indoleamine 2,3-dioxygenase [Dactylonectria macrodidyma]|uniref:Indoleamine 2,3-dioxygenase n=1 Tax=Dactylonectria macrodidyma TaxID=307937 RepID=A0A9P9DE14_9HYPO|nr:indoleamine 2,3-dioxygenase [Dactylonectria macrodidyma]